MPFICNISSVASIVDQAQRRATFILSFEGTLATFAKPTLVRMKSTLDTSDEFIRVLASVSLIPSSIRLFPSPLPPPLVLYSLSLHPTRAEETSFRIPSSFQTPMLVCSVVKRNGQTMSLTPHDLWNLCYSGVCRSSLLLACNASTIPLSLRFHYWGRG